MLPSFQRPLHLGSAHAGDLSKAEVSIYLQYVANETLWYLIFTYIDLFWFVALKDETKF